MNKEKLSKILIMLFESKMKSYTEKTIDIWIELLEKYSEISLHKAIEKLIYTKDDFISIGQIHEMLNPSINYDEIALKEWDNIVYSCKGHDFKGDELAVHCFYKISNFQEYGYLTDDFKKNQIRKEFLKLYKEKLKENNNTVGVTNDVKQIG